MTIYFTPIRLSVQVPILGTSIGFSIKIPGTYSGLQPNSYVGAGRFFKEADFFTDNFALGEYVKDLKLTDTDGKIGATEQALLPAYPDVLRFYDVTDANANGFYLRGTNPVMLTPFDQDGNPLIRFMMGELYITGTFVAAATRTLNINIKWGRWLDV